MELDPEGMGARHAELGRSVLVVTRTGRRGAFFLVCRADLAGSTGNRGRAIRAREWWANPRSTHAGRVPQAHGRYTESARHHHDLVVLCADDVLVVSTKPSAAK
jgi:hypothetical protein